MARKLILFVMLTLVASWQSGLATTKTSSHKTTTASVSQKKHSATKSTSSDKSKAVSTKHAKASHTSVNTKPSKKPSLASNKKPASKKTSSQHKSTVLAQKVNKKKLTITAKTTSKPKPVVVAKNSKQKPVVVAENTSKKPANTTSSKKTKLPEKTKLASNSPSKHHTRMGLHATNLQRKHHGKSHNGYGKTIRLAIADLPEESKYFADEIKHGVANLSGMVNKTIATMRYSHYQMGGTRFDPSNGVYVVDCSSYVDRLLNQVNPEAYFSLVNGTGTSRPTTEDFYHFFNNLAYQSSHYWRKVDNANNLQAGDILVFRSGWNGGGSGHVMVVMNKPVRHDDVLMVRVADSASSGHSQDTRPAHTSGIGIGTMLIKVNNTNQPAAYAWRVGAPWENVRFAMGRPLA